MNAFFSRLSERQKRTSLMALGLDPEPNLDNLRKWGAQRIIDYSRHICCVKFNLAFYLAHSGGGITDLKYLIDCAHDLGLPTILDGKFNDVGHSSASYAIFAFKRLRADAVTLNPLLGEDSVKPFADYSDKAIFLLGTTSNPSSRQFMSQQEYYSTLLELLEEFETGVVIGANMVEVISYFRVRSDSWLLCPGVGAQGADADKFMQQTQGEKVIVPVSRYLQNKADGIALAAKLQLPSAAAQ